MICKHYLKFFVFLGAIFFQFQLQAQDEAPVEENKREVIRDYRENIGITYDKSWAFTFKYRTDGWDVGADYHKTINFFKSRVIQFGIGEVKHFKQKRQSSDPSGGIFGFNGFKPYVYGKQNSFFVIHGNYGRRHLLAERAKKNGVMIQLQYTGGVSIGILKGYQLEVYQEIDDVIQGDLPTITTGYVKGVDIGFTSIERIKGYSGFGKGFGDLGIQPGVNGNLAFQFDWSNQDNFVKALELGFHADIYFWDVPIMVAENRPYFFSVYAGIALGKKMN
jgi:hypothetical protein